MDIRVGTTGMLPRQIALVMSLVVMFGIAVARVHSADEGSRQKPVPDVKALKDAETSVRQALKSDFAKKTPSDRQVLAKKLIALAAEQPDHPEKQYSMLSMARDLSIEIGELSTAFEVISALDQSFAVDPIKLKVDSISRIVKNPKLRDLHWSMAVQTLAVAEEAVQQIDYDSATKLTGIAVNVGKRIKQDLLQDVATTRQKELVASHARFDRAKKAAERLQDDANDASAKTILGEFYCGVAGNWQKGLLLLSDGDNAALRDLAKKDLAGPTESALQVDLGNGWMQIAESYQSAVKSRFQRRGRTWFLKAWPQLTGLAQADVEKKINLVPTRLAVLSIRVEIDGVDEIVLTETHAELNHRQFDVPKSIQLNGEVNWRPDSSMILVNAGPTHFLPEGLNFTKARVEKLQGRGEVRVTAALDRIKIEFRDGEVGSDTYEVLVLFTE